MCRNIHTLYNFEPSATNEEIRDASLQYVRKISGFTKPSQANAEAFARAVDEVTAASKRLLDQLVTSAPPKDRVVEAERARARARSASTSPFLGAADVTSCASKRIEAAATSSTARAKAASFACDGFVKPLILRTY